MTEAPTYYHLLGSGDLGWSEVCEERPATQRARFVEARMTWLLVLVVAGGFMSSSGCYAGRSYYGAPATVSQAQIPRLWAWAGTPITVVDDRKAPPNYVAPADGSSDAWAAYSKEIVAETRRIMLEGRRASQRAAAEHPRDDCRLPRAVRAAELGRHQHDQGAGAAARRGGSGMDGAGSRPPP